ncbi:sensor domain-containing diguanylate cyclase [Paenibacillus wulumuqiensis]|uniref:sensor domain-containing diguanylate cyclase n=1 Tax=Paenibacillus wulumuqiensis TaxID=1567107 RepID=UPI000619A48F|nr:GGDEF domain-containing protein [Paenibacillus wulumuqiensis]
MNDLFMDFLTIQLPTYFFLYMAITLIYRNRKSRINRAAALLMMALVMYFLFEYLKTSLLPQYQMQLVLYGSSPSLLLFVCTLVHLSILLGDSVTYTFRKWLPLVYASPYVLWLYFLLTWDHHQLYNEQVTDGRSPLHPTFLLMSIAFIIGYILLSVLLLAYSWLRTREPRRKVIYRSLLLNDFQLFGTFALITTLLQSGVIVTRVSMIFYFIGYLVWAMRLRHLIGKYNIMPDYRKLFQTLFESAPNAILLLDLMGNVKEMNPRAERWFINIPIKRIPDHFTFADGQSLQHMLSSCLEQPDSTNHLEMHVTKQGQIRLDLVAGIDLITGTNEDLFVLHLTDVTPLKETERRLIQSEQNYKHSAHHDALTGLYNRAAVEEQLQFKIAGGEHFALVMIDLNHFKPINDTYGHMVGDQYLQYIAQLLRTLVQKPGDVVGRIGGDEFVLLLACPEHVDVDRMVHTRLSTLEGSIFRQDYVDIPVSFAAGMGRYPEDAADMTGLLRYADQQMYSHKRQTRRSVNEL